MKCARRFLLAVLMGFGCLSAMPVRADEMRVPPPPELVKCVDEATCDRDPEHFIAFADAFFKWYILTQEALEPSRAYQQAFQKYQSTKARKPILDKVEDTLRKTLTREFWDWRKQLFSEGEKDREASCHLDANPILCAQDWNLKDWLDHPPARVLLQEKRKILVSFPVILSADHSLSRQRIMTLKPEHGVWRIDSVIKKPF